MDFDTVCGSGIGTRGLTCLFGSFRAVWKNGAFGNGTGKFGSRNLLAEKEEVFEGLKVIGLLGSKDELVEVIGRHHCGWRNF